MLFHLTVTGGTTAALAAAAAAAAAATMTTPSSTHTRSPSCSPEALHSLLSLLSSKDRVDQPWDSDALQPTTMTPQPRSGQSTPPSSIFAQVWRPCTGEFTIGRYLDSRQFPISFRDLGLRWKRLGTPPLQTLHMPLSLRNYSTAASSLVVPDLCEITRQQERTVVQAIESHFDRGFSTQTQLFIGFASHLDIYCSVHAELCALEQGLGVYESTGGIYNDELHSLFLAFELDRAVCSARASHDCIGRLLWGEMYSWPLAEIRRRFDVYKGRALRFAGLHGYRSEAQASRQHPVHSAPHTPLSDTFAPLSPNINALQMSVFASPLKSEAAEGTVTMQDFPWTTHNVAASPLWSPSTPQLDSVGTLHGGGHCRSQSQPQLHEQHEPQQSYTPTNEILYCEAALRSAAERLDQAARALSAKVAQFPPFLPSRPRSKTTSDVCA